MILANISNDELILRMQKLVRTERKVMHLVLPHIAEIEYRKLYADLGFDGMYSYLTQGLGYSESAAYRRLKSARLLKQIPSVAEKIEDGSLNLSQLTQVQKCLKESTKKGESISIEQATEVLAKLENKNSFETQKTLALEMNLQIETHEKIKPQRNDSVRLELTLTKEQFEELEKAKSLLSHICPDGSWSDVISTLAKTYNSKKLAGRTKTNGGIDCDLTANSKISNEKSEHTTQSFAATKVCKIERMQTKSSRQYLSIHTKRILFQNANHCCEYKDPKTNKKCHSTYKLEIDHRHPVALGGTNEFTNLRILCQTHNALAARKAGFQYKDRSR